MATKESLRGAELFLKWLRELGDGVTARDLGEELFALGREMNAQAISQGIDVKGSMAITFNFTAEKSGVVTIKVDSKVKTPKRKPSNGIAYLTPAGDFTMSNPKQMALGNLREVHSERRGEPAPAARDEDDDSGFGS